ncbi:DUF992 domain-containing protein [Taklimakanibacter albus]|uniref:DUF992 domain-containing protein n=1 Tax=Taklimakanibacter albus TaxID=2800327 RepID=A0ACC5R188_9HYPH|nr:DUF992 domain-containing protein [Aestuariivirga sp. YIM B02566]MBK1866357.1 DUF992 domain-containing protein [Aestuariivirga sp. YIM B02566]
MTVKGVLAIVLAAGFIHAAAGSALAASGVNVGVLKCTVDGGVGLIFGSSKDMKCNFAPAEGGAESAYHGTVTKVGIDIGVTEKSYITWVVFAPGKLKPNALIGTYVGATADVAIGVGLGANVLVGGFEKSIALQPLSVSGEEGLNVAVGIGAIELKAGH